MRGWLLLAAILGICHSAPAQNVRYVRASAPPGGDGMTWGTAYNDLQTALAAAGANLSITQLWIAEGDYKPAGPGGPRTATFALRNNLALYGGFEGDETALEQRDIAGNPTTLSGDLNGDGPGVFSGWPPPASLNDNSFHIVTGAGVDASARLDGLRISGGAAMGAAPDNVGGAILCSGASPTVDHCTFIGNYAADRGGALALGAGSHALLMFCHFEQNRTLLGRLSFNFGGGAIYLNASNASISNCTFQGNRFAPGNVGGAILCTASAPHIVRCDFLNNGDAGSFSGAGGAISLINGSDAEIADCTFTGNRAAGGGSIAAYNGQASIRDCLFQAGASTFHAEGGGAISCSSTNAVIVGCTFDRLGAEGGGAIINANSSPLIVNCRFTGNACFLLEGGAIWNTGISSPTLINCAFTGNFDVSLGGSSAAIHNNSTSALTAVNCTFASNAVKLVPGGAAVGGANVTLRNCIVVHNTPAQLDSGVVATYSCIEGGWAGVGNIASSNPNFVDENGPDNVIGTPDDDVRLVAPSPCIDAARNADVPADTADVDDDGNIAEQTPRDLAMRGRFYDHTATADTGDGTPPIVDMGAFEFRLPCPADVDADSAVNISDLLEVINNWGACPPPCPPRCAADIDPIVAGDCQVNINDLLAVINSWGPCP